MDFIGHKNEYKNDVVSKTVFLFHFTANKAELRSESRVI